MTATGATPPDIESVLAEMTLDEKCAFIGGADLWHNPGVERLGIRPLKVSDGPVGVRGDQWTGQASSTSFPCGSTLGATWDPDLLEQIGACLGREARDKGVHVVLGPTVNLHRTPLAGRNMECYSEDPFLSGMLGSGWIRGIQAQQVGCTIKHFAANDQEYQRHSISAEVDERTLRELYLRPFEMAVRDAGAWGVMSAYNRVNGVYCAENPWLLTTVLRDDWGFDGFVISDWYGTHSTVDSAVAGLDLEMPGPAVWYGAKLADAARAGEIDEAVIDERVRSLLRTYARTGALDPNDDRNYGAEGSEERPEHRSVARAAAIGGFVLLRNDGVLPIAAESVGTIAVIGPSAEVANIQGGGSARINPHREPTPLDGIRSRFGADKVVYERGCTNYRTIPILEARRTVDAMGFTTEYFAGRGFEGEPVRHDQMRRGYYMWLGEWCPEVPLRFSARTRTTVVADEDGEWTFSLVSAGRSRLLVDGELVVDNWEPQRGEFYFGMGSTEVTGTCTLAAGRTYELLVEFETTSPGLGGVQIGLLPPLPDDMMERAEAAAATADVAVVVVGTNSDWETEGRDRDSIELPLRQRELIERVAAANPRTVVCVNAGAPVDLGWLEQVGAAIWCGLPGQEWGDALAAVLAGDEDPGGRLPTTMPRRIEDNPSFGNYPGEEGRVHYGERGLIGYRWYDAREIEPALCFGHGLSYATFEYGDAVLSHDEVAAGELDGGATVTVSVDVTNTSDRDGTEVVQCYVHDPVASVARAPQELVGFAKVRLAAGERRTVTIELGKRAFAFWSTQVPLGRDASTGGWLVEPGELEIRLGRSSRDPRTTARLTVT